MQEDGPKSTTTSATTSTGMTSAPGPTQEEYDTLAKESQAYMISMIVFIISTVGLAGLSFFYFKKQLKPNKTLKQKESKNYIDNV